MSVSDDFDKLVHGFNAVPIGEDLPSRELLLQRGDEIIREHVSYAQSEETGRVVMRIGDTCKIEVGKYMLAAGKDISSDIKCCLSFRDIRRVSLILFDWLRLAEQDSRILTEAEIKEIKQLLNINAVMLEERAKKQQHPLYGVYSIVEQLALVDWETGKVTEHIMGIAENSSIKKIFITVDGGVNTTSIEPESFAFRIDYIPMLKKSVVDTERNRKILLRLYRALMVQTHGRDTYLDKNTRQYLKRNVLSLRRNMSAEDFGISLNLLNMNDYFDDTSIAPKLD